MAVFCFAKARFEFTNDLSECPSREQTVKLLFVAWRHHSRDRVREGGYLSARAGTDTNIDVVGYLYFKIIACSISILLCSCRTGTYFLSITKESKQRSALTCAFSQPNFHLLLGK